MSRDEFLNIYPRRMSDLSQGFALYKPVASDSLKPGMCGYFDDEGDWNLIVDINAITDSDGEYSKLKGGLRTHQADPESWGPVCSQGAKYVSIKQKIAANVPTTPASFGVKLEFTSTMSQSAALISAPVEKLSLVSQVGDTRFHDWCKANSAVIMKNFGQEVKDHGLWIVKKTSSTARCCISVWKGANQKVSIGVSLDALSQVNITGSGQWGQFAKIGNWREFASLEENPKTFVIFLGGLKYKYDTLSSFFGGPSLTSVAHGKKDFEADNDPMSDFLVTVTYKASVKDWDIKTGPPPVRLEEEESDSEQTVDSKLGKEVECPG